MRLSRYAPLEHALAQQFQRAIDSLTAALAPASARQYRAVARSFLIYLGEHHPSVGSLIQLRRDPHVLDRDTLRTQVSPGTAALPRLAYRESDGTYLLVYQTGGASVSLWIKTSTDPHDWSSPARALTVDGNNHDALPVVLADGSFVILWSRVIDGGFQVVSSRSMDGVAWQPMLQHSDRPNLANIQTHALPGPAPDSLELYWGAAQQPGDGDYDIVREAAVRVAEVVFADGFDSASGPASR